MKRPLAVVGFSALISSCVIITMPKSIAISSLALFALLIIIHSCTAQRYTREMLLSLMVCVLMIFYIDFRSQALVQKLSALADIKQLNASALVVSRQSGSASTYYTVKIEDIDGKKQHNFKLNIYTDDVLEPGQYVNLQGKYSKFSPKQNTSQWYSKNTYGYFNAKSISLIKDKHSFQSEVLSWRQTVSEVCKRLYDSESAGLVLAVGIGDKSLIDKETSESFIYSGISHALVVSGLHIGIIIYALNILLYFIPLNKKLKNCFLIAAIFLLMAFIGFTASVTRAGFLAIAVLVGKNFTLETDTFTTLATIALITVIINPYAAISLSLLLSYSAFCGVISAINLSQAKGWSKLKTSFVMTCFAVLFTAPILTLSDMKLTLLSPVFNIILSPLIMAVCILSFATPLLSFVPILNFTINPILIFANKTIIKLLLTATAFIGNNFSFALVNLSDRRVTVLIFAALIGGAFAFAEFSKAAQRKIFTLSVCLLTFLCYNLLNRNIVTLTAFDSGSETSFVITKGSCSSLVLAEIPKESVLNDVLTTLNLEHFDSAYLCLEKAEENNISQYCESLTDINQTQKTDGELFCLESKIENDSMIYTIIIGGKNISFSHKNANFEKAADIYFFGSDAPVNVQADDSFYFYPSLKKNTEKIQQLSSFMLYGKLEIQFDTSRQTYKIVKDVKNFGGL